jgi:hypothetical protein
MLPLPCHLKPTAGQTGRQLHQKLHSKSHFGQPSTQILQLPQLHRSQNSPDQTTHLSHTVSDPEPTPNPHQTSPSCQLHAHCTERSLAGRGYQLQNWVARLATAHRTCCSVCPNPQSSTVMHSCSAAACIAFRRQQRSNTSTVMQHCLAVLSSPVCRVAGRPLSCRRFLLRPW